MSIHHSLSGIRSVPPRGSGWVLDSQLDRSGISSIAAVKSPAGRRNPPATARWYWPHVTATNDDQRSLIVLLVKLHQYSTQTWLARREQSTLQLPLFEECRALKNNGRSLRNN